MHNMRERIIAESRKNKNRCVDFIRKLIATPSESCNEEQIALLIRKEMIKIGYDSVHIDRFGNVIGIIGNGPNRIMFDAHVDTINIGDRSQWRFDPFEGNIKAGKFMVMVPLIIKADLVL